MRKGGRASTSQGLGSNSPLTAFRGRQLVCSSFCHGLLGFLPLSNPPTPPTPIRPCLSPGHRLELASASAGVLPPEPPPVPILQPVALDFAFYRCLTPAWPPVAPPVDAEDGGHQRHTLLCALLWGYGGFGEYGVWGVWGGGMGYGEYTPGSA